MNLTLTQIVEGQAATVRNLVNWDNVVRAMDESDGTSSTTRLRFTDGNGITVKETIDQIRKWLNAGGETSI